MGASATWLVMDFAYCGNTVMSPRVLAATQLNGFLV
jgi:hypothetical protein